MQPVTLIRFGLIALFLGCANGWGSAFNDATAIAVMIVFSVTNGYFASREFWSTALCSLMGGADLRIRAADPAIHPHACLFLVTAFHPPSSQ